MVTTNDKPGDEPCVTVHFPVPSDDDISAMLRSVTREIDARGLSQKRAGVFGGADGYGCDYENDVFLMHHYCWCEQDACLWCGAKCEGAGRNEAHREDCYDTRLDAIRKAGGRLDMLNDDSPYAIARTALCKSMGLDPEFGCEVHCTCDRAARVASCACDWHQGRGRFRFGQAAEAPHFWHKPTGVRVRWYKYIGRGMEIELHGAPFDVTAVFRSVIDSLPNAAKEQP